LIAAHDHPVDVEKERARLDDLANGIAPGDLDALRHRLYVEHAFAGNDADYYDPGNSFLDVVLDRRRGIPITLAVVLMEVGRRCGVVLEGINAPAHFLVRHAGVYLDPFDGAKAVDLVDVEPAVLDVALPTVIVSRMLANLKTIYTGSGDVQGLEWVLRLRTAIPGVPPRELAELAAVLANQGRVLDAATALDDLATRISGPAADRATRKAHLLRASLN
jgi:regulator of sirC expression with transglutaminase-like and TPR domain